MRQNNDTVNAYVAAFEGFEASLNGGASSSLHARRREAIARLREDGLPTARFESWKHTNPAPMTRTCYAPVGVPGKLTAADIEPFVAAGVDGPLLVFADGRYVPGLSRVDALPAGIRIHSLSESSELEEQVLTENLAAHTLAQNAGFSALNTAFVRDAAIVVIDAGRVLDAPVQILHVSTGQPGLTTPRTLVLVGAGGRVSVVETIVGISPGAGTLTASVTEIVVDAGAVVEHCRIHLHGAESFHAGTVHVTEEEGSRFTAHTFCLTGRLVREDMHTVLRGERIESTLNGLCLPDGEDHVDNYTTIEHAAPDCTSHELYKGVVCGKAHSVFRGKIHVHRVAQKTDAYQSNQNLLMSDDAEINSKPQLEIYADDVKCSHGSTTGQLDASALFYLRTRGVGLHEARRVLTRAFAGELLDRLQHEGIRAHVDALVSARLDAILAGPDTDGEGAE
jgi:Fe-S cluster assembly protein SufD